MIEKPTIIVTSLGRTGTKFFSKLFDAILTDSVALHEPDVFHVNFRAPKRELPKQVAAEIRRKRFEYIVARKALGRFGLIRVSDARLCGAIDSAVASRRLCEQRSNFVLSNSGSIYMESNAGYYGLVDLVPDIFLNHRVAYLVRDGRSWIRSKMDWGEMYGKGRLRRLVAHTWPTAADIQGDPLADAWHSMTRFERLCWAWTVLNKFAINAVHKNECAAVFRFEDIFYSANRDDGLMKLIEFLTSDLDSDRVNPSNLEGWLDRRIHKSTTSFPDWIDWTADQKKCFSRTCGPLMEQLGYRL